LQLYLAARHLTLTEQVRDYVERHLVEPVRRHNRLKVMRMEVQLFKDTERGHHFGCHVYLELKGPHNAINIRENDESLFEAIDLAQTRLIRALSETRDRLLTLSRHPKKYSFSRIARALGWVQRSRAGGT
jgi:ribosomal subunit interface protein